MSKSCYKDLSIQLHPGNCPDWGNVLWEEPAYDQANAEIYQITAFGSGIELHGKTPAGWCGGAYSKGRCTGTVACNTVTPCNARVSISMLITPDSGQLDGGGISIYSVNPDTLLFARYWSDIPATVVIPFTVIPCHGIIIRGNSYDGFNNWFWAQANAGCAASETWVRVAITNVYS